MGLGSPVQALTHLDLARGIRGLAAADEASLLERAGEAALLAGRYQAAQERYGAAVAIRRSLGDHEGLAAALAGQGESVLQSGRAVLAAELLESGLAEVTGASGAGLVALLGRLAFAYQRLQRRDDSMALLDRMLVLAEQLRLPEAVVDGINSKIRVGRPDAELDGWLDRLAAADIDQGLETFRRDLDYWPAWAQAGERSVRPGSRSTVG